MSESSAAGVITLTTDFGHKGPFVATMKGVMLTRFPAARIVDLTHEIMVHWPAEAGFWLERSYRYFPRGTVHLAVVDPGVGTERQIVAAELDGHLFLAPDNGLLTPLLEGASARRVHHVDVARLGQLGLTTPSATFHGRDVLAPLAAELAAGRCTLAELGPPARELVPSWIDEPTVTRDQVSGLVITVDNFGNLITNVSAALIAPFERPMVHVGERRLALRRTYADARPGDYLALINSFGVLEIARAEQSAAEGLGLGRGAPVAVRAGA
jgi:S-adenosylmethionine hydrolase